MTRAGAGNLAFGKTDSFLGSLTTGVDSTVDYYEPGIDPSFTDDPSLQRNLEDLRKPNEVFTNTSVAGNIEGSFGVDFVVESNRISDVHDILYNNASGSGDLLTAGEPATSRWYVGVNYHSGKAERVLLGCIPESVDVQYEQGGAIRYSVNFLYADEKSNASFTPSSTKTADGDTAQFHSTDFSIDGTTQSKEQSFTLSISGMSGFHYGSSEVASDATVAAPEATLDVQTIFTEADQKELAYGGSGQTSTSALMDAVSGAITLNANGSQIAKYNLSGMKLDNYDWPDVINADADMTESYSIKVNGVGLA